MEQTDLETPTLRDTKDTVDTMKPGNTAMKRDSKNVQMVDIGGVSNTCVHPDDVPQKADKPAKGNTKQGDYELANLIRMVPKPGGEKRLASVFENQYTDIPNASATGQGTPEVILRDIPETRMYPDAIPITTDRFEYRVTTPNQLTRAEASQGLGQAKPQEIHRPQAMNLGGAGK